LINKAVLDASVALSWLLPGEETQRTLPLRDHAAKNPQLELAVPPIFWYEVEDERYSHPILLPWCGVSFPANSDKLGRSLVISVFAQEDFYPEASPGKVRK